MHSTDSSMACNTCPHGFVVGLAASPLYSDGPDSNVYPSLSHACAAPPATTCDSSTVTESPLFASNAAAHNPPIPAPITTTSDVVASSKSFFAAAAVTRPLVLLKLDFIHRPRASRRAGAPRVGFNDGHETARIARRVGAIARLVRRRVE